jgi:hypothetical protein
MNGRAAGTGTPILFGGYLLYEYLPQSRLFDDGKDADLASMLAFLGAFLFLCGAIFLIRNLKY